MSFRPLWAWRLFLLGFAIVYLASDDLQAWLPPLVPFLAAAAVEAHSSSAAFAPQAKRCSRTPAPSSATSMSRLEGAHRHRQAGRHRGRPSPGRAGHRGDRRVAGDSPRRAGRARPGAHELAAIETAASPVALHVEPTRQSAGHRTERGSPRHSSYWRSSPGCSSSTRGVSIGSTFGTGARGDDRRPRPAGGSHRRAPGRRDLRRGRPARRLRPGRGRTGRGRRPPCLVDAPDLLPALSDPPQRARQRPGVGSRSRCSLTKPGT